MKQRGAYPLTRLSLAVAEKQLIHGMVVAIDQLFNRNERAEILEKITVALDLIESYAPVRLEAMKTDVQTIFVHVLIAFGGRYDPAQRMVEVNGRSVLGLRGTGTPESLACLLVHEAQHARLFRLGFGYEQAVRARIEALCYKAQLIFARALPNGEDLATWSQSLLDSDLERAHSPEGLFQRRMDELRRLGCPDWSLRLLMRIARARGLKT